jgi:hypothetical protein
MKTMTVDDIMAHLQMLKDGGLSGGAEMKAWNGDSEQLESVTGFLYDDNEVEICTDEP